MRTPDLDRGFALTEDCDLQVFLLASVLRLSNDSQARMSEGKSLRGIRQSRIVSRCKCSARY